MSSDRPFCRISRPGTMVTHSTCGARNKNPKRKRGTAKGLRQPPVAVCNQRPRWDIHTIDRQILPLASPSPTPNMKGAAMSQPPPSDDVDERLYCWRDNTPVAVDARRCPHPSSLCDFRGSCLVRTTARREKAGWAPAVTLGQPPISAENAPRAGVGGA